MFSAALVTPYYLTTDHFSNYFHTVMSNRWCCIWLSTGLNFAYFLYISHTFLFELIISFSALGQIMLELQQVIKIWNLWKGTDLFYSCLFLLSCQWKHFNKCFQSQFPATVYLLTLSQSKHPADLSPCSICGRDTAGRRSTWLSFSSPFSVQSDTLFHVT